MSNFSQTQPQMDISNNNAVAVKKKSFGRRKIPIELIRKKSSRQITFCKRRQGLFKKAAELSVLCGAQITILVRSPVDKICAFGDPKALIAHFQSAGAGGRDQESARSFRQTPDEEVDLEELDAYAEFLAGF